MTSCCRIHTLPQHQATGLLKPKLGMQEFRKIALPAEAIARAIAFAIEQPDDVDVNEIIVRPTASV
ncbi:hypothetical protein [Nostoc sp.]|uniref:hypothetical protein n=1 Tax=Nostoc sp. TaxID=1180 RepID=UPI003FA541D7